MIYDLARLPLDSFFAATAGATALIARLDERIGRSREGEGLLERLHFADACASLWVDGELVHPEDLVLHDAGHDIRTPTHELTIARDVLRTRRKIAALPAARVPSRDGLAVLREGETVSRQVVAASVQPDVETAEATDPLRDELASIDALLARSERTIENALSASAGGGGERNNLVYDLDWDEAERFAEWNAVRDRLNDLPPVLGAAIALDAFNRIEVLQHAPWMGRLLGAAILRQSQLTSGAHLLALNTGLKSVPVDRRRHPSREVRIEAILQGMIRAAEIGLAEHDRLVLARRVLEHKLARRRSSSKMPQLVDFVLSRPLVSTGMISSALDITQRAALRLVEEMGLREMTGRGRFRAWGIV